MLRPTTIAQADSSRLLLFWPLSYRLTIISFLVLIDIDRQKEKAMARRGWISVFIFSQMPHFAITMANYHAADIDG